ncbi:MAG: type II toxin-antitoxin system prevent-host-death family antitoxin [Gemmatimonadales bacterium]|nr:type II toxin-antitoxin system prevent-host-death family antitoxin [Gemmatimonadales bacterium]MYC87898.1 type II toxin-antitoxin system prevent-host-death family antitoxin [Candidatus Palauibacter denitrificans]
MMPHTESVKRSRERSAMELAIREAKARLSELVAAARSGERVIITKHGRPAVELVRCDHGGGIDFEKLEAARRRLGMEGDREPWPSEYDDPAFSRRVLGLDIE